jgi:phosphopantothenoylcysteine decarboxylase/phosphopantothenate--cysteine ligase
MKRVLLIVGGGVAAYKALELVRLLAKAGVETEVVLTKAGAEFVTPLSFSALTGRPVRMELFDLTEEAKMGHIELSRSADLIVVAPATADLMAKAANGLAGDLATTTLLATDKPVLMAPAMNVRMWLHPATRRNLEQLEADGVAMIGPNDGEMACGEYGPGRMAEPAAIRDAVLSMLRADKPLAGKRALVTAGPTREPIDPVRYLTNRSSGRQGYAIAAALAGLGADVTLVSGPTALPAPLGVRRVAVETAEEMLVACRAALPAEVAVMTAAVSDWRPESLAPEKIKKGAGEPQPLKLVKTPDILATLAAPGPDRPRLVVGFAAETEMLETHARAKLASKGADWIVGNDVTEDGVMGGGENRVILFTAAGAEPWPRASKPEVAEELARRIAAELGDK